MKTTPTASPRARTRDALAALARTPAAQRLSGLLTRLDRTDGDGTLAVLVYHRIDETRDGDLRDPAIISATPPEFEHQIAEIARRRPIVSLQDVLAAERGEAALPAGAVLVTFDDAYRDFLEHAWPVLRRHGVPVTMFVPTAYPDHPERVFWWDRLFAALHGTARHDTVTGPAGPLALATAEDRRQAMQALRAWVNATPHDEAAAGLDALAGELAAPPVVSDVLGWDELRALRDEGVTFGAHTRSHPLMGRLPLDRAVDEARGSLDDLERELGSPAPALAYPGGSWTGEIADALRESAFTLAFTMQRGGNDLRSADRLALRRINVGRRSSSAALLVQTTPAATRSRHVRGVVDRILATG